MAEYISREDAYNVLTEYYHHSTEFQHGALREAIARVPIADVQPVVHGKWVYDENGYDWNIPAWRCSECHVINNNLPAFVNNPKKILAFSGSNYCPNCGAKMIKRSK